ncbi:MAG: hypothetical protein IT440_02405 [Phycisphaeraceae bacterium]|nr:hypothetical protein [Phycisphaeraceae bacterium]
MKLKHLLSIGSLTAAMTLGAVALGEEAKPAPATQPYPLNVCIVSDEELGTMGDPVVLQYEGREIRFCCEHCVPDFKKDPQKYLKKLAEAKKASSTQPATTQPAPKKPEQGQDHGHHH